MNVKLFF